MKSQIPKALHRIGGKTTLAWVLDTLHAAGAKRQIAIIPENSTQHSSFISEYNQQRQQNVETIAQKSPDGTGHAVELTRSTIDDGIILVAYADTPLVTADTYIALAAALDADKKAAIACLGFIAQNPHGYGRMITDTNGNLTKIIEEKDATTEQKSINFVNAGIMALRAPLAFDLLKNLDHNPKTGEKYLTDCIALAREQGHNIITLKANADEVMGINTRQHLAEAEAILQNRLRSAAMDNGATLISPETVFFHHDTILGQDVIIEPHVIFGANVHIGEGSEIKSFSHLEGVVTGPCCVIGPYARLRPGAHLGEGVRVGNFVEVKNTEMGDLSKANHLTYLGDSTVGARSNIGAGTITCNYDGINKNKTEIGEDAFIGSNTALVAPISVGDRALIGAGSTITQNVGEDDLALTRPDTKIIKNGAKKRKAKAQKSKQKT